MQLTENSVGRKLLMAVTGALLLGFVIVHLLGNSSVFLGPDGINSYAENLHNLGPIVWVFRLVMLGLIVVHIWFGVSLTLENSAATPIGYASQEYRRATFSSRTMIYTGLALLAFIIYHLLHFTVQITDVEFAARQNMDAINRPDVFGMVVNGFKQTFTTVLYVVAMIVLFLHLSHGVQSILQTVGLSNDKSLPVVTLAGKGLAFVLLLGYISIPILIIAGIVKI
ncbi:MAG: succinate dehydrogenase cytochrome b subunit [Desulfuromonadales bacterium]|nr:succinate dehydrogenase cytochrome b subunit [Desulfuromonadales bacterium]MDT8422384.1 succinate dehydrogenase cytochrome b subunit [Desulfuromonadales bacterium]